METTMHANGSPAGQPGLDRNSALRQRHDAPLGTLIYRAGLLPADEIERVLADAVRQKRKLGQLLLERGLITEEALAKLLANQKGLAFTSLRERDIDEHAVSLLDRDRAWRYNALPIGFENGTTVVAIEDPSDEDVRKAIADEIGQDVEFVVAPRTEVIETLSRFYPTGFHRPGDTTVPARPSEAPSGGSQVVQFPSPEPVAPTPAPVAPAPVASPAPPPPAPEPAATPTPVPAPVATPAPDAPRAPEPVAPAIPAALPAPAPQPVVVPVPVAEAPPVSTATLAPSATPAAPAQVVADEVDEPVAERADESADGDEPFSLVVRMADGERVDAGTFENESAARLEARALMRDVGDSTPADWPFVAGRFLRPDRIVSIDVVSADDES